MVDREKATAALDRLIEALDEEWLDNSTAYDDYDHMDPNRIEPKVRMVSPVLYWLWYRHPTLSWSKNDNAGTMHARTFMMLEKRDRKDILILLRYLLNQNRDFHKALNDLDGSDGERIRRGLSRCGWVN